MEGKSLAVVVGVAGLAVIALGTVVLYSGEPPPPPERPQPPPPPEVLMNSVLKYSQPVWLALVETDAKTYKVPAPKLDELRERIPYYDEFKGRKRLKIRQPVETAHLRLSLDVAKTQAMLEGQSYAADHLVLKITNRTDKYLAYRVDTAVADSRKCLRKGDIEHNALVLKPNETIARTECQYRKDESLEITHVEIMELLPIQGHYVGRLPASPTMTDPRTSGGHAPLAGALCPQTFSWRDIQDGVEKKQIGWRDVIDYYARHNCEEYSFYRSYRYRTDPNAVLPARPLD